MESDQGRVPICLLCWGRKLVYMSNYLLFLDDERFPSDALKLRFEGDIVICRDMGEAIAQVTSRGLPAHICFDHDLGEGERTGHDFAKWLVDQLVDECTQPPHIHYSVHSQNPIGADNIRGVIEGYHKWCVDSLKI